MRSLLFATVLLVNTTLFAANENFDDTLSFGKMPASWVSGITGKGSPHWEVMKDTTAPSRPGVLLQSGIGAYPWAVDTTAHLSDGVVEVKLKALGGEEDQAGGVVWRWKDSNNYYVARANALENNVSLYHTTNGRRITIKYVDAPVAPNVWHTLRAEFAGTHVKVLLGGKVYIELDDPNISGSGSVGVWTKADSKTAFDDFMYGVK